MRGPHATSSPESEKNPIIVDLVHQSAGLGVEIANVLLIACHQIHCPDERR
jgi:hypothetical protein